MSPEQAEMSHLDVDTRADIYSLGALLYDLLTGSPPFPEQRLRSAGYNEMQRIILEEQPERPSTRLSTLQGEQRSIVARNRGASELTLGRAFPSDLDWIVMKCLEKDRARRYETANGLAHDIERHLRDEPVTARPPSRLYEFQKTLRRHWVGFTAVAAVVAALSIGVAVSTWQTVRARRAEGEQSRLRVAEAKQRAASQQSLYKYVLGEARAARLARRVGYRDQVFALLKQANALDVPERKPAELSAEAVACLGDFVGLTPATLTNFSPMINYACMDPSGKLAAFVVYSGDAVWNSGTIELRVMPSGRVLDRFNFTNEYLNDLCFNSTGDQLLVKYGLPSGRFSALAPDASGHWRETENRQLPAITAKLLSSGMGAFAINVGQTNKPMPFSNNKPISLSLHKAVIGRPWNIVVTPPDDLGDTETRYAVFRLLDVYTGAFVPGYEATNALPRSGEVAFCATSDARVLAVETQERENPNSSVLVDLFDWMTGQRIVQFRRTVNGTLAGGAPLGLSDDGAFLINLTEVGGTVYTVPGLERIARFRGSYYGLPLLISGNLVALPEVKSIRLWNFARREDIAVLDEPDDAWPVAVTANGASLLTAGPHHARFYRLSTPEKLDLPPHATAVPGVAFSPDGLRLASVSKDKVVRVCDARTGRVLWETNNLPGSGQYVSFSPDGQWLAVGHWDSDLVWIGDAHTGRRLLQLGEGRPGHCYSAQFSPDGRYLATAFGDPNGVKIWTLTRGRAGEADSGFTAKPLKAWGEGANLVFAPDSRSVAFCAPYDSGRGPSPEKWGNADRPLYIWDFERSDQPRRVASRILGTVQSVAFATDGRQLLAMDANQDILWLDVATGTRVSSCQGQEPQLERSTVITILPSPDSSKFLVTVPTPAGGAVSLLDPKTGEHLYSLPAEAGVIPFVAWSPDSRRVAVARDNGNIAIWDLEAVNQILAQLGLNP
jgi:WD40 repeat protein